MGIICGVDIIEIERIKKSLETIGDSFKNRVYTENEISYCEGRKASRFQSYAARFAAKEAVSKALGTGIGEGVTWKDMEILNNEQGRPYVLLYGRAREVFQQQRGVEISISLSHCSSYAVAYAVMQTES